MVKKKDYLESKRTGVKSFYKSQTKFQAGQQLDTEQQFMQDMFNSSRTWGPGQNLPQFNGILISGNGLINNEDNGETGGLFGLRR